MKKMRIRINKEGKTSIVVEGGVGADCLEFTALVEKAVGIVEKREFTEDYEQADTVQVNTDVSESESL